jgi:hypothetical protein
MEGMYMTIRRLDFLATGSGGTVKRIRISFAEAYLGGELRDRVSSEEQKPEFA